MPARLGVIADDLTGANDTGVQFARQGARTLVPLDWHDLAALGRAADVLVLNTNSRALPADVAARRARVAAEALRKARVEAIYKKIDSTCRGNVGAELEAILDVYTVPLTVLAPTFPPAARAVRDGILTIKGTPVHRTSIGRDPVTPVRESHLPTLLGSQLCRPIYPLSLSILRGPADRAANCLKAWREGPPGVVLADAVTPRDLERLASLLVREGLMQVVAGSAGLAMALSTVLPWPRRTRGNSPAAKGPVLLVLGSPNPVSLEQVAWAESRGHATAVRATISEVVAGGDRFRRELDRVVEKVQAEILAGRDTVLTLRQRSALSSRARRPLRPSDSGALSEFLGRATRLATRNATVGALVLCGGDIAIAACRALRAGGIELMGEVEAGVPWGRMVGGELPGLPTVTKAGGFGGPATFSRAIPFLRHGCRSRKAKLMS
jgi:D-threonate/D-erythronate kinase